MAIVLDKFIDALFIFLGVFFAFYFDQYQEDQAHKKELRYHLSEIIQTLPIEKPLQLIAPLEIKIEKDPTKKNFCTYSVDPFFESSTLGADELKIIKERGLTRFIDKKDIIMLLTVYYRDIVPQFKEKKELYYEASRETMYKFFQFPENSIDCSDAQSVSKKDRENLKSLYLDAKVQDQYIQQIGYYLRQELEKLGYRAGKKNAYQLNYTYQMAKTPEHFAAIAARKEALTVKEIGETSPAKKDDIPKIETSHKAGK